MSRRLRLARREVDDHRFDRFEALGHLFRRDSLARLEKTHSLEHPLLLVECRVLILERLQADREGGDENAADDADRRREQEDVAGGLSVCHEGVAGLVPD